MDTYQLERNRKGLSHPLRVTICLGVLLLFNVATEIWTQITGQAHGDREIALFRSKERDKLSRYCGPRIGGTQGNLNGI